MRRTPGTLASRAGRRLRTGDPSPRRACRSRAEGRSHALTSARDGLPPAPSSPCRSSRLAPASLLRAGPLPPPTRPTTARPTARIHRRRRRAGCDVGARGRDQEPRRRRPLTSPPRRRGLRGRPMGLVGGGAEAESNPRWASFPQSPSNIKLGARLPLRLIDVRSQALPRPEAPPRSHTRFNVFIGMDSSVCTHITSRG